MKRPNELGIKKYTTNRRHVRLTTIQKQQLLAESELPGNSIAQVARKYGVSVSTVFDWRNKMKKGALIGLSTKEELVPASEVKALKMKVRELERMLGKKTVEVEVLKEAVELGREKKLISLAPLHGVDGFQ